MFFPKLTLATVLEYPSVVSVYGTENNDYISGSCEKKSDIELNCKFTQILIKRPGKPEHPSKGLARAANEIEPNWVAFNKRTCSARRLIFDALKTGEFSKDWNKSNFKNVMDANPNHKMNLMNRLKSRLDNCDKLFRKNAESMAKFSHNRKMRTCEISGHSYDQMFSRSNDLTHWVSNTGPSGKCGVVIVNILRKIEVLNTKQWSIETKITVTNKKAKMLRGLISCEDYPEESFFYGWEQPKALLACDHIKFGL